MVSVLEISKPLFVLWFAAFKFLRFSFIVIRKYKHKYDNKIGKHNENIIGRAHV